MKKKILIVEDNKDSREILGLFITKIGCQVIKACNSKEAITYAEAECPDLIFMDMDLPDADGIKTTTMLRTESQNLSHSCHCAHGVDLRTMAGKGWESGYRNLLDQTGLTSDVKGDHRGIHEGFTHPDAVNPRCR